jgi:hypothetical protein
VSGRPGSGCALEERGIGRLKSLVEPEPIRRYQRQRPGERIHLDIKKVARFTHITGNRRGGSARVGYDFFHVAIDDCHQARLRRGLA